ncbi:NNMT/PNMT/TEMT family class I SAM-dependent methyltransferase [Bosea sp. 117]|uniref:NNMT/PNMT/TEMT family class I SAM-dependent methyltransferase n=1 Tax=Bosea sp. 117 TaxID=1125973 RepID=UPI000AE41F22|nr:NNMT/PNMT/TEMT family class I SAM-dependent methyltransferase [Bosea sp. 117]
MSSGNADLDEEAWAEFDSEAYFLHYYEDPHPDDDLVVRMTCEAIKRIEADRPLDAIDVGTGPNLYPMFCALPRARSLTAFEYSRSNVAWLKAELEKTEVRPQWTHFWKVVRDAYGPGWELPDDPVAAVREKATISQGSIYDLPERQWDVATMFFCAEAVTNVQAEFDRACACFARAVRPGGTLIAAFLLKSEAYIVAGRQYPVMTLTVESLFNTFSAVATDIVTEKIGIVEHEVRSGYTGMVFLTAKAK